MYILLLKYLSNNVIKAMHALEFAKKHNFYTAAFNHLLPFPNTPLYNRLKEENRLIYDKWWLADGYNYGELAFEPKKLSAEKLSQCCYEARQEYASTKTVWNRGMASLGRTSPLLWSLFWAMNLRIGGEVGQKMNVPIGENLDELPKETIQKVIDEFAKVVKLGEILQNNSKFP